MPDSKGEVTALQSIVGTLHRCRVFGPDNRCAPLTPVSCTVAMHTGVVAWSLWPCLGIKGE